MLKISQRSKGILSEKKKQNHNNKSHREEAFTDREEETNSNKALVAEMYRFLLSRNDSHKGTGKILWTKVPHSPIMHLNRYAQNFPEK